jgi:hypothetical protein
MLVMTGVLGGKCIHLGAAQAGSPAGPSVTRTVQLLDMAAPIDSFIDLGDPGPTTGDVEVFRDTVVWARDSSPAGHADGHCTLIQPSTGEFQCSIVATLPPPNMAGNGR